MAAAVELQQLRRASWAEVTATLLAFTAFPMTMPVAFARAGWWVGSVALVYMAAASWESGVLLGKLCVLLPAEQASDYPQLAAAAMATASRHPYAKRLRRAWASLSAMGAGSSADEPELERSSAAWAAFGRRGVAALQLLTYYLAAVVGIIYLEQYFVQLFPGSSLCQAQWIFIVLLLMAPLQQIPTFKDSWAATILGATTLGVICLVFFYQVGSGRPWECELGPAYECFSCAGMSKNEARDAKCETPCGNISSGTPRSFADVAEALNLMAYSFGGHGLYPETIREMKHPQGWRSVMVVVYSVLLPLYMLCGLLGFAAYGTFANANINLNWPNNAMNKVSIVANMVNVSFTLLITQLLQVLQVELALGVDPTAWWRTGDGSGGVAARMRPVVFRLFFRSLWLGSQVLLAEMLLSGEGDTLFALQSLVGSVGMLALTFLLPFGFHLALHPQHEQPYRAANHTTLLDETELGEADPAHIWLGDNLANSIESEELDDGASEDMHGAESSLLDKSHQLRAGSSNMTLSEWGPYSVARRWWHLGNIVVGVVLMGLGLYYSVQDLVGSSTGLFNGSCQIPFQYSPMDPRDPCYAP